MKYYDACLYQSSPEAEQNLALSDHSSYASLAEARAMLGGIIETTMVTYGMGAHWVKEEIDENGLSVITARREGMTDFEARGLGEFIVERWAIVKPNILPKTLRNRYDAAHHPDRPNPAYDMVDNVATLPPDWHR